VVRPPPADQFPTQRFDHEAPVQRPQSLVSHKLPLNPNFNRALLADTQPQNADARTVDDMNIYAPHHGEPSSEAQLGGIGRPTSNQPPDTAEHPTMTGWQDEYGGTTGYPGREMYNITAENDGYHSLPRMATNRGPPVRAAEQPPQPPPPPPPPNPRESSRL